ncbi:hypothetical protein FA10DRAFT_304927 [Acaromyces ingoldii]|uniref:Sin3 associated polypeptide p18-domain-containing protein n=1 Tax=Acaromyces ingoldii TaxID=215250 RepID=A0A316YBG1_9BASI|nr:hypothetical protein FA10DRAFT_304927 [Acaromyces ingoldii]PWN86619.1 hypothetical protein FA10DRAFT_304927 [Acaromyces ingoldii]
MQAKVRLPSPGEEATPFLLRCYVQRAPFRPIADFDPIRRTTDEYKVYVWRSATLRDIAILLHHHDPRLSGPTSLHAFRIVSFDPRRHGWVAREAGADVARVGRETVEGLLLDHDGADDAGHENGQQKERSCYADVLASALGEVDEAACRRTLDEIGLVDGEVLDCVVREPRAGKAGMGIAGSASRGRGSGAARRPPDRYAPPPSSLISPDAHPWGPGGNDRAESLRERDRRPRGRPPLPPPPRSPPRAGDGFDRTMHMDRDGYDRAALKERDRHGRAPPVDRDGHGPAQWGRRRQDSSSDRAHRMREDEEPRRRRSRSPRR